MLLVSLVVVPVSATDSVTVARYAPGETEPEFEETYSIVWMEEKLPVMGDGIIHYYLQGPIFDESEDPWNPDEDINCYPNKDMGALRGTDVMDLCELAGGADHGDVILIRAEDGFRKSFPYENVYTPPSCQGRMVIAWEKDGQKAGAGYGEGMRLQFFADTSVNPWGEHIFGISDMRSALPEEYWHFYQPEMPASTGLSVQSVSRIEIYESSGGQAPVVPSGDSDGGADDWTPATGTLTVSSVPADAAVVIDGAVSEYLTNVSIADIPEGHYGITVEREGYETPDEEWVMVSGGSNATVSFSMTGITTPCMVISHPAGAAIAVDGIDTGIVANAEPLSLILGNHTLTLTMDGYAPREIPIRIISGGTNRVESVLVPLCNGGEGVSLSMGPQGSVSGSLQFVAKAGYPGFIAGGETEQVDLPGGAVSRKAGNEISSYLFFSHGYDTASGLPAEPQPALSSGDEKLVPRLIANALTPGDTVSQTCALSPSPSTVVSLENAGGAEDVFSLSAVASLLASPGSVTSSYAVYEGCIPAGGAVCNVPADALPEGGTRTLTVLCTQEGARTDPPVISVNGMIPDAVSKTLVPGVVQITAPLPPGGASTIATGGNSTGWLVRVVVVNSVSSSSLPDEAEEGPADRSDEDGDGLFASLARFFASLFSWSVGDTPSPGDTSAPDLAGITPDVTPVPAISASEIVSDGEPDAQPVTESTTSLTGGLLVETVPSDAWITLDGKPTGKKTPTLFAGLKEGIHRIGVSSSLTGDSRSETAWVYPEANVPVFFDFSNNLPETTIRLESPTGVPVKFTFNGRLPEETTPTEVTVTDTGSFVAVISDWGYQTYPLDYHRSAGPLVLAPAPCGSCTIRVTSDPDGAEIFVDGKRTEETTPADIDCVSTGRHRIVCSLPGYYPEERVATVADISGSPDMKVAFTLEPYSNGGLSVTSDPVGAKIYLYDRFTGLVTPAIISDLPIGTYEIGLSTADETLVREVTVLPDTVTKCAFKFGQESVE